MKPRPLVTILAFAALFFAMLLPPEAYPDGKMAIVLSATFVFMIALFEQRISLSFLKGGAWAFGLLLLHTIAFSIDKFRSFELIAILWAYYCLMGFFAYTSKGSEKQLATAMVVLSLIVSGYGLYQYFWGFDKLVEYISYSGADQIVTAPALNVIAARRVYSTLALPGTLWGFLVCAIPFHLMLWGKNRFWNSCLLVSGAALMATGFLTRSFGFLLGLFVLVVCAVWMRDRRLLLNRITPVVVILMIVAGLFYSARRGAIQTADPVGLRFKNWISAWNIFAVHPMGTGINTFGVIYPEYMQPGANETQFVHNTPLQLLSELGYPLIVSLIVVLVMTAGRKRFRPQASSFWLLLALAVWITHNLVDIDVYFGSMGVLGSVLIGFLLAQQNTGEGDFPPSRRVSRAGMAIAATFSIAAIVFSASAFVSGELQNRAQAEYETKKLAVASQTLAQAVRISPFNSSLYHDRGEILLNLYQQTQNQQYLADATESFRHAVALSPEKSGSYVGYALCFSSAKNKPAAITQIRNAQRLFPAARTFNQLPS